ncbi:sensor histidine kinase [Thermomonas paludicola]|uniref:sensor histidine kinase n=1 Tax=Thermomonas paludicola TaxID=2884874 RepID=UPI00211544B3|nr:HAMP domain-containing sensor histidine kinase [Thermomonas paludicola]
MSTASHPDPDTGAHSRDAAARRERDFTRDASHELRTPLTVIRVASDLIAHDTGLSDASRRSLARIHGAVAGMEAIIDALLLLARGDLCALDAEDVPVLTVVRHEVERVQPQLQSKGLAVQLEILAQPVVHAPARVLEVMLGNLLGNALRFTDVGEVRVRLLGDRLDVEDTGIGMDAATLARAFEPFFRGNGQPGSGPGLGLSIAYRLGQRCEWPLLLTSVPGHGTRASILFGASLKG